MRYQQLAALKLKPGTTVYLILDDSKKEKRGKVMDAVTKLHGQNRATPGHLYVTAVIRAGHLTIPFAISLYANPDHSHDLGLPFRKSTELAAEMIRHYSQRWWIEVFFKDSKQLLGLGQYQNRPYRAAVIHLHLVCFAWTLLTHLRLQKARGAKAKGQRHAALRLSTAQAQNDLRRLLWQDLFKYLEEKPSGDSLVKELQRLLIAA